MNDASGIIESIVAERRRRGWSQYRLSKESGVPQPTLNAMEAGRKCPTLRTLNQVCETLGLTLRATPPENTKL